MLAMFTPCIKKDFFKFLKQNNKGGCKVRKKDVEEEETKKNKKRGGGRGGDGVLTVIETALASSLVS